MRLYIPNVGDLIRVTDDVTITVHSDDRHVSVPDMHAIWQLTHGEAPWDYNLAKEIKDFTLVKGTVLKFKRLFVSSHARTNAIEVSIFAHPEDILTPRAQGGKAKRTITFTMTTHQLNLLDYERVDP